MLYLVRHRLDKVAKSLIAGKQAKLLCQCQCIARCGGPPMQCWMIAVS